MQRWVWSLVQEDSTCFRAAKPMCHSYLALALESESHNYWACAPRACAVQQSSHCSEEPTHRDKEQPPLTAATRQRRPTQPKKRRPRKQIDSQMRRLKFRGLSSMGSDPPHSEAHNPNCSSVLTLHCLNFLICKMGRIAASPDNCVVRIKCDHPDTGFSWR